MAAALPFHICDVFTTGESLSGNQLLVVEDVDEILSDASMQAIASEIGFAESAFIRNGNVVRIFTTDEEVPQAGHPIIGLSEIMGGETLCELELFTRKGPIRTWPGEVKGTWWASQDPPEWLGDVARSSVAALLRGSAEVVGDSFPVGSTCGLPYALVPVPSEAELDALVVDPSAPCDALGGNSVYFYARTGEASCRTRMFCHEGGRWIEDVATGSAAGPLACHLAPLKGTFTQGSSRRATIHVKSTSREGCRVEIGGSVRRVAEGKWRAPGGGHSSG